MDAAPSATAVATTSPAPPPAWPDATQWASPPADLSVRLPANPSPVWSRPAQAAAALLLLLALALLGWHAASRHWGCRPSVLEAGPQTQTYVDLNQADHAQLVQLPGVGDGLARRILAYREEHEGFRNVDELRRVGGIGPNLLEKLRPFVRVEPRPRDEQDEDIPHPAPKGIVPLPASKKLAALKQPIDVNRASAVELQRLPGIGPKLSQRILDARATRPFRSTDDLRRVPGIGPKTLERLRPHVVAGR